MNIIDYSDQRLQEVLDLLLDDQVGIIHYLTEKRRDISEPNFFYYIVKVCNTQTFCSQKNFNIGGGASIDRQLAIAKAIGEAIERYCPAIYNPQDFYSYTYQEAPFACVPPQAFATYTVAQCQQPNFFYVPFEENTPVRWTPAQEWLTGKTIYVPAVCVYIPYTYDIKMGEKPILFSISTGQACHFSFAEAAISGICEVIERDAFTITWQAMLSPPKIRLKSLNAENYELIERFQQSGGRQVTLLDITMDTGVPTVLAIQQAMTTTLPAILVATAAALTPEEAIRKSLEELALTSSAIKKTMNTIIPPPPDWDYNHSTTKTDHWRYWCQHTNVHHADFLTASKTSIEMSQMAKLA